MGKTLRADALAEMGDGVRIAEKVLKAHELSLEHLRVAEFGHRAGRTGIEQTGNIHDKDT
jgi:hypothetical protein